MDTIYTFPLMIQNLIKKNAGLEHYAEFKHVFGKILELSIATLLLVDALIEIVLTASEKPNKKKNYAY